MRRCDWTDEQAVDHRSCALGAGPATEDGGEGSLALLLACLSESACPLERLALVARFARLAAAPETREAVRRRALRTVQDLATRKQHEAACVRGVEEMKLRSKARHGS